jgi:hypothetical protein
MVRVMGKLEVANAARANTRTEAMEVGGCVAGAGCDGIEWMRPNQPYAGERQPAFADGCGTLELNAKKISGAPLRSCQFKRIKTTKMEDVLGVTTHDASERATGFKPKEETTIAPCVRWLENGNCGT